MSSVLENSVGVIEDIRVKRRSSIFRPDAEPSQRYNDLTSIMTPFPSDYIHNLLNENEKWKEACTTIKIELVELKRKVDENVPTFPAEVQLDNIKFFETYLKKTERFFCVINNSTELHQNILRFQHLKKNELRKQIEITSQTRKEKLSN